ncbi:MAG TPA: permease prefix domain 1-containing protein [Chondromyces sp.]|nr:permease prefix domain 1-containing protein [Chondromyces sp.]
METTSELLEQRIAEWRASLRRRQAIHAVDVDELEDHLRDQIAALGEAGLSEDEAFLVAVKRMGDLDSVSREFAREYSERLWKQLVVSPEPSRGPSRSTRDAMVAVGLAIAAAVAIKLPELFGISFAGEPDEDALFYLRNFSLLVLPFLAVYFAWRRDLTPPARWRLAAPFIAAAVIVNVMPFATDSSTEMLVGLHLPIALWLAVGYAYSGGRWRDHNRRMDFIRFSGEFFIYFALIGFGGGVLMGFTLMMFEAIGLNAESIIQMWVLPCGVAGAVPIAGWLVEAKQSVIENMAPVLTRLFTPLFTVVLVVFVLAMMWTGSGINLEREVLIAFDLLLVLVLGLLLYSISARDPLAPPGVFDALQLVLVVCAILVDALALWAIAARISEFGFSPNKVAALGENLVLLVNLGWSAVLSARFVAGRGSFAPLERWQTAYLPVYAIWAWIVVVLFPILFRFT